jgi:hypothetical protein
MPSPSEESADTNGRWNAPTLSDVYRFFGKQPSTVTKWIKAGMPGQKGKYPLDEIAQWLIDRRGKADVEIDRELKQAKLEREQAEAQRAHWRLRKDKGNLIERRDAEQEIKGLITWFVLALERIEAHLVTLLVGRSADEMRDYLGKFMGQIRQEIADSTDAETTTSTAKRVAKTRHPRTAARKTKTANRRVGKKPSARS